MSLLQTLTDTRVTPVILSFVSGEITTRQEEFFVSRVVFTPKTTDKLIQFSGRSMRWSGAAPSEQAKRVLAAGDYLGARQIVKDALTQSPDSDDLQELARVLAPPRVKVASPAPANSSLAANRQWLRQYGDDYQGKWVALRDGHLVVAAENVDEIKEQLGTLAGLFVTKVF